MRDLVRGSPIERDDRCEHRRRVFPPEVLERVAVVLFERPGGKEGHAPGGVVSQSGELVRAVVVREVPEKSSPVGIGRMASRPAAQPAIEAIYRLEDAE